MKNKKSFSCNGTNCNVSIKKKKLTYYLPTVKIELCRTVGRILRPWIWGSQQYSPILNPLIKAMRNIFSMFFLKKVLKSLKLL